MARSQWFSVFFICNTWLLPNSVYSKPKIPDIVEGDVFEKFFGNYQLEAKSYVKHEKQYTGTMAIFGGFNSCGPTPNRTQIYKRAVKMLWKLADQQKYFRLVLGCFGPSNTKVKIQITSNGDKTLNLTPSEVSEYFNSEVARVEVGQNYLIGHSYGGWLSIDTAIKSINHNHKIEGLASIDPISAKRCTPTVFASGYMGGIWNDDPDTDCTRAPKDLAHTSNVLQSVGGWWKNFFQDNSSYLHSGPMASADNMRIDYDYDGWTEVFKAHMDIDGDDRVWSEIELLMGIER